MFWEKKKKIVRIKNMWQTGDRLEVVFDIGVQDKVNISIFDEWKTRYNKTQKSMLYTWYILQSTCNYYNNNKYHYFEFSL